MNFAIVVVIKVLHDLIQLTLCAHDVEASEDVVKLTETQVFRVGGGTPKQGLNMRFVWKGQVWCVT
jgi:hypothetical protein